MPKRKKDEEAKEEAPEKMDDTKEEAEESSDDDFGPARPAPGGDDDDDDSEEDVGPKPPSEAEPVRKKRRTLKFESLYLSKLPSAKMYERSFMHRSPLTQICVSKSQFIITASRDGFLKFWKKTPGGIEFVKQYRAHIEAITGLAVSSCGFYCCSISTDKQLKIYDVMNFDMINLIQLKSVPTSCEWIHEQNAKRGALVAVGNAAGEINVYRADGGDDPVNSLKPHRAPVKFMKYNEKYKAAVSVDAKGMIEYWSTTDFKTPKNVKWTYKTDTDLYELRKQKTLPLSVSMSPVGKHFAIVSADRKIRVFNFAKAKMIRVYDENLQAYNTQQADEDSPFKLDNIDFGRRMAVERELDKERTEENNFIPPSNVVFDQSGYFILFPTLLGIKVVNLHTNKLSVLLGLVENTERFLGIALFQGIPKKEGLSQVQAIGAGEVLASGNALDAKRAHLQLEDPCVFACAYKKERFYWFSRREPGEENRDIFNEKPMKKLTNMVANQASQMGSVAVVHTTMGDMTFVLFPKECPKTVENFVTHSKDGYYNETIFHRVIKNFMVQGGDPLGDGTGGESIWGGEFEDEFHRNLRHDRPGVLSMANAGPNTNGSQFFVTTVPCPWLNDKHTVFGRLSKGMDVLKAIEGVHTTDEKPDEDIKIINIDILT
mmetsp:Transcript_13790/g.26293  ORF Transcript_13790/g.26293 Transcript_13790/m.26293 type:complete len:658 (-) Transcript_13790:304-2277(-)